MQRLPNNLVFHWWIPDDHDQSDWIRIFMNYHAGWLSTTKDVFDKVIIVLAYDNYMSPWLDRVLKFILITYSNPIIKLVPNDAYRESRTFRDELVLKLDELDGNTYFFHSKGISNWSHNLDEILNWVGGIYYCNLILGASHMTTHGLPYTGGFVVIADNFTKNNWEFSGTGFWINTRKVMEIVKYKGLELPRMVDRYYSERFLGNLFSIEESFYLSQPVDTRGSEFSMYHSSTEYLSNYMSDHLDHFYSVRDNILSINWL